MVMKTGIYQILQKINHWFTKEESIPAIIFNCRELLWITPIESTKFTLEVTVYGFKLYFGSGLWVKVEAYLKDGEDSLVPLENLRKLFINAIGYSYLSLNEEDIQGIQFIDNSKKNIE